MKKTTVDPSDSGNDKKKVSDSNSDNNEKEVQPKKTSMVEEDLFSLDKIQAKKLEDSVKRLSNSANRILTKATNLKDYGRFLYDEFHKRKFTVSSDSLKGWVAILGELAAQIFAGQTLGVEKLFVPPDDNDIHLQTQSVLLGTLIGGSKENPEFVADLCKARLFFKVGYFLLMNPGKPVNVSHEMEGSLEMIEQLDKYINGSKEEKKAGLEKILKFAKSKNCIGLKNPDNVVLLGGTPRVMEVKTRVRSWASLKNTSEKTPLSIGKWIRCLVRKASSQLLLSYISHDSNVLSKFWNKTLDSAEFGFRTFSKSKKNKEPINLTSLLGDVVLVLPFNLEEKEIGEIKNALVNIFPNPKDLVGMMNKMKCEPDQNNKEFFAVSDAETFKKFSGFPLLACKTIRVLVGDRQLCYAQNPYIPTDAVAIDIFKLLAEESKLVYLNGKTGKHEIMEHKKMTEAKCKVMWDLKTGTKIESPKKFKGFKEVKFISTLPLPVDTLRMRFFIFPQFAKKNIFDVLKNATINLFPTMKNKKLENKELENMEEQKAKQKELDGAFMQGLDVVFKFILPGYRKGKVHYMTKDDWKKAMKKVKEVVESTKELWKDKTLLYCADLKVEMVIDIMRKNYFDPDNRKLTKTMESRGGRTIKLSLEPYVDNILLAIFSVSRYLLVMCDFRFDIIEKSKDFHGKDLKEWKKFKSLHNGLEKEKLELSFFDYYSNDVTKNFDKKSAGRGLDGSDQISSGENLFLNFFVFDIKDNSFDEEEDESLTDTTDVQTVTLTLQGGCVSVGVMLHRDGTLDEELVARMFGSRSFFLQDEEGVFLSNSAVRSGKFYTLHTAPLGSSSTPQNELQRFLAQKWQDSSDMIKRLGRPANVLEDAGLKTFADFRALDEAEFEALSLPIALKKLLAQESDRNH